MAYFNITTNKKGVLTGYKPTVGDIPQVLQPSAPANADGI